MSTRRSSFGGIGVLLLLVQTAIAADAGIVAKKIALSYRVYWSGLSGKFVFVGGPDEGIQKGPGGDPLKLAARLEWSYEAQNGGSVGGAFDTPVGSAYWTNSETFAKYKNPVPCLETCLKTITVRTGKVFKAVSPTLSQDQSNVGSLFLGPPTDSEGILVVASIQNGNDGSTHRICTRFARDLGSTLRFRELSGGYSLGRKLVAKGGVPTNCP